MDLGIIVFTNQQSGADFTAITNTIKDRYLGISGRDWVKDMHDRVVKGEANAKKITGEIWTAIEEQQKKGGDKTDIRMFIGNYHDKWFGEVVISVKDGKPWF